MPKNEGVELIHGEIKNLISGLAEEHGINHYLQEMNMLNNNLASQNKYSGDIFASREEDPGDSLVRLYLIDTSNKEIHNMIKTLPITIFQGDLAKIHKEIKNGTPSYADLVDVLGSGAKILLERIKKMDMITEDPKILVSKCYEDLQDRKLNKELQPYLSSVTDNKAGSLAILLKKGIEIMEEIPKMTNREFLTPGSVGAELVAEKLPDIRNLFGNEAFDTANEFMYGAAILLALSSGGKTNTMLNLMSKEIDRGRSALYIFVEDEATNLMNRYINLRTGIPRDVLFRSLPQRLAIAESKGKGDDFDTHGHGIDNIRGYQYTLLKEETTCLSNGAEIVAEFEKTGDYIKASDKVASAHISGLATGPRPIFFGEHEVYDMDTILDIVREGLAAYEGIQVVFFDQMSNLDCSELDPYMASTELRKAMRQADIFATQNEIAFITSAQATEKGEVAGSKGMWRPARLAIFLSVKEADSLQNLEIKKSRGGKGMTLRLDLDMSTAFIDYDNESAKIVSIAGGSVDDFDS